MTSLVVLDIHQCLILSLTRLACFISAGVQVTQYDEQFVQLFTLTMHQLRAMLPVSTNIKEAYKQGSNDEQNFIQNLSLFLCTFLKEHGLLIEKKSDLNELLMEVCNLNCSVLVTARKRSLGQGNIFTPVCYSVHGGSTWAGTPHGRHTPLAGILPWAGTPRLAATHPWAGTPPPAGTPPAMHAGIRSTSGRYVSYWNAFLLKYRSTGCSACPSASKK